MEDQNNQNQDAGKIAKRFETAVKSIVAILGDPKNMTLKQKVKNQDVANLVENLFAEERLAAEEKFKADLKALIIKKSEYDAFLREEEKKVAKAKEEKQKQFAEAAEKLFQQVTDLPSIVKGYYEAATNIIDAVAGKDEK